MLKPSHREKNFTAKRVFTDREDARAVFGAACDRTETRELYQVLMWYGVGGQGKSALLREFARMLASRNEAAAEARVERRLALAKVDFDDERLKRIDSALYSLRLQLAQSCGFAFHTFDAAFVSYYRKTRPGIDVAAEFPELFMGEKEGLADLLDVLDDHLSVVTELASVALPGANLIYKWGMRLTGRLKTWWSTRGNKVLAGIEQLTPEEILQKLPSYLGVDLCDGIAAKPSVRPVIFLDTYEALWRERGQKDALTDRRTDAWVRLLVQDAPGTLVVIAGRDMLRWSEIDPAWGEVIDAHLLGGLSAEDADRFLRAVPIVEDDIRAKIVGSSEGLPFYLDLQVTQYEAIRERGEAPAAAQFGGTPSDILSRFLEHLNDTDQSVLRLASYFNTITRPAMTHLADAFPQRAANFSFDRMVARSAFTPVADDAYTIHALMQEELQRRERDENEDLFRKIHRHLFEYYRKKSGVSISNGSADVFRDIESTLEHAYHLGGQEYANFLTETRALAALHPKQKFLESSVASAIALLSVSPDANQEYLLQMTNNLAVAQIDDSRDETGYETLVRLSEMVSNQTPQNGHAKIFAHHNLALASAFKGNVDEALFQLDALRALTSEKIRSRSAISSEILLDMAALSRFKGDLKDAESYLLQACGGFEISEPIRGPSRPIALSLLFSIYAQQGRYREAIRMLIASEDAVSAIFTQDVTQPFDLASSPTRIDRPISRILGDYSNLLFRADVRNSLRHYAGHENRPLEPSPRNASTPRYLPTVDVSYHPDSQEVIRSLIEDLKSIERRVHVQKVHIYTDFSKVKTVVFLAEKFMCQYDHESRIFFVICPPLSEYSKAFGALFYCETHWAAARLAGIAPPRFSRSLKPYFSFVHGLNLDTLTDLACDLKGKTDDWKDEFLSLLSDQGNRFLELQWAGASREELYQQYAVMWDSIRNPEAKS